MVDCSSFAAEIFRKKICLGCFSASVNALYYDKKSAFVFQNKNAPFGFSAYNYIHLIRFCQTALPFQKAEFVVLWVQKKQSHSSKGISGKGDDSFGKNEGRKTA
jgi:hypothetical protein